MFLQLNYLHLKWMILTMIYKSINCKIQSNNKKLRLNSLNLKYNRKMKLWECHHINIYKN